MRFLVILAIVISIIVVGGFGALDRGLSGGSASSQEFVVVFTFLGFLLIFLILLRIGEEMNLFAGALFAVSPFLIFSSAFFKSQSNWQNRPEAVAIREEKRNIKCVMDALRVDYRKNGYLRARLNIMYGEVSAQISRREIEEYLGVQFLQGCRYHLTRPDGGKIPPPGTPFPNVEYTKPSASYTWTPRE